MRALLKALVLVPLALALVLFCVANRKPVTLSFDPVSRDIPAIAYDLPLFALVLTALFCGILIGGFATWLSQGRNRKMARVYKKETQRLQSEADTLRAAVPQATLAALPIRRG
jgi:uncharacterized integral membrane protein